jgi:hypothetical protein
MDVEESLDASPAAVAVDGATAAGAEDSPANRWARWDPALESLIVGILAIASLAAAWSAYQSNLWGGEQAAKYAQASARRIESTRMSTYAHQLSVVDVLTFSNFVNAYAQGNTELADFYEERFRPDFRPAFNAWMALDPLNNPDAPPSPFAMPEYALPELQQADELEAEASALFEEGQEDNDRGDRYVLNTVILATAMFFSGVAPRLRWFPTRIALVAAALVMLAIGFYNVATYPVV